jgi:hypothetical protein
MTNDQAPMTNQTETKRQCPITGAPQPPPVTLSFAIAVCLLSFDYSLSFAV